MDKLDISECGEATAEFERELESVILTAFGRGARIEGNWTFRVPVSGVSDWYVTIDRMNAIDEDT